MENTRVPKRPTHQGESPRSATSPTRASKPAPLAAPADPGQGACMSVDLRTLPIFPAERKNATGMPDALKTGVETLSGFSMDKVRVHYHSPHAARVRARAYTQGTDIHIGPGQEKHLPHEAWHVVQQMQGRVKPTTQMGAAMLNDDEELEQEAEREGQRANSLAPRTTPGRRRSYEPESLPRLGQQTATPPPGTVQLPGRPVLQRMPFDQIQAGRYYRVRIGNRQQILYLKEKRSAKLTGTGSAHFYFEYNGEIYLIKDEANILAEVAKPEIDEGPEIGSEESGNSSEETQGEDSKSSDSSESESSESEEGPDVNPRVLGVASWNVAHFSDHDIQDTLEQLQEQLALFSSVGGAWKELFPAFRELLQAIKDNPLVEKSMKPPEKSYIDEPSSEEEDQPRKKGAGNKRKASRDDDYREEPSKKKRKVFDDDEGERTGDKRKESGKDKYAKEPPQKRQKRHSTRISKPPERLGSGPKIAVSGMQDPQGHFKQLLDLITSYGTEPEQFDIDAFVDRMDKLASFDWEKEYRKADSPEKRVLFAQKVKELRKVVDDITKAKRAYAKFRKIQEEEKLLSHLGDESFQKKLQAFLEILDKVGATLPRKKVFDNAARALHSPNIVKHIDEMFKKNKQWLDIMLLQEVNNPKLLEEGEHPYVVRRGPHLMSGGAKPQNEYYPLLIRKGSGISVRAVYVVETNGEMKRVEHDEEYKWNKKLTGNDAIYRPIVVYDIVKESEEGLQRYWIGIVHTTPESDSSGVAEFNRRAIYKEIKRGLKTLKEKADEQKIPLIIGGDYYLSAEAVVKDLTGQQKEHSQRKGSEEKKDYDKSKEAIEKLIQKIDRELKSPGEEEKKPEVPVKEQSAKKKTKRRGKKQGALIRDDLTLLSEKPVEEEETDPQRILLKKIRLVLKEASKDEQILRTIYKLTVAKQIKKLGLYLAQTVSGTNPKKDPLENWYYLQIADFFVHNEQLKSFTTGIMRPGGGILSVDTEGPQGSEKDLSYSKYWQHFSDHFPVGAVYSLDEGDLSSHPAMVGSGSQKAKALAKTSNINRFARLHLKQNDLTGVSEEEREKAALAYLKGWLPGHEAMDIETETAEKAPETVEEYIKKIQALEEEHDIPPAKRLFVTLPGDFEPDLGSDDDQSASPPAQKPSPGTPGAPGGKGDGDKPTKKPPDSRSDDPTGAQGKGSGSTTQQGSGSSGKESQKKDSESTKGEKGSKGAENAPQGSGSQTGQRTVNVGDLVLIETKRGEWTVVRVTSVKPGGKADVELPALRSILRWRDEPVSELPPAPADKQLGDTFPKQ